jgi:hypothetical protein
MYKMWKISIIYKVFVQQSGQFLPRPCNLVKEIFTKIHDLNNIIILTPFYPEQGHIWYLNIKVLYCHSNTELNSI